MTMQEKGKWKPYNVKAIVNNVKLVFKNHDINKLNKPTYHFIINHMGFIAHYSLAGFQDSYQNLERLAKHLQTSEYSDDHEYNLRQADRCETDHNFREWYGEAYNKSIAEAIRGIVEVAQRYYPGTRGAVPMFHSDEGRGGYTEPLTAPRPKKKRSRSKRIGVRTTTLRGIR